MFLARRLTSNTQKYRLLGRCLSRKFGHHQVDLPPVDEAQSLQTASSDVFLICDTNLVIAYQMAVENATKLDGDEPLSEPVKGWYDYANKVAAHGTYPLNPNSVLMIVTQHALFVFVS